MSTGTVKSTVKSTVESTVVPNADKKREKVVVDAIVTTHMEIDVPMGLESKAKVVKKLATDVMKNTCFSSEAQRKLKGSLERHGMEDDDEEDEGPPPMTSVEPGDHDDDEEDDEEAEAPVTEQPPSHPEKRSMAPPITPEPATKRAKTAQQQAPTTPPTTSPPKAPTTPTPSATKSPSSSKAPKKKVSGKKRASGKNVDGLTGFDTSIRKLQQKLHPDLQVSTRAMQTLNDLLFDMYGRLTKEAGMLLRRSGRKTLTARDLQAATQLLLSGELGAHAVAEGTQAVARAQR